MPNLFQRPTHRAAWSNLVMAADDSDQSDLAEARAREAIRQANKVTEGFVPISADAE